MKPNSDPTLSRRMVTTHRPGALRDPAAALRAAGKAVIAKRSKPEFDLKDFLTTASPKRSAAHYARNATIYRQGAVADAVYYVREGRIKLSVASTQGKEAIIAILGQGEFFGEGCLIGQDVRSATAVAMVKSEVTRIDKPEMLRVLRTEPAFSDFFTNHLLLRNRRIEEDLVDQLFNSSEKRLARVLLILANFGKEGGPQEIITPLSHETLAEIVGTTRPRVSHFMNKFKKLGFISCNGHLRVHSSLLTVVLQDAA